MKKNVLKFWETERFRRGLAAFLCASVLTTGSGFGSVSAGVTVTEYDSAAVYDVLLDAAGMQSDGVNSGDVEIIRNSLRDYFDEKDFAVFESEMNAAAREGTVRLTDKSMEGLLAWVSAMYDATGGNSPGEILGLEGRYDFTKEYKEVKKYDEEYGVLTPTNTFSEGSDGWELGGTWTLSLDKPVYRAVNCTEGTSALYSRESMEGAFAAFGWDDARTFNADAGDVQSAEASGSREVTAATKTVFGPEDYDGDLHVHTGNELTGGGCYSVRGYHSHRDSCKDHMYAMDYDHETEEDRRFMIVSVKQSGNGWLMNFRSDGLTDRSAFMSLNTDDGAESGNYNWYYDYQHRLSPTNVAGEKPSNYVGFSSLHDMFGIDVDGLVSYLNGLARDIKSSGTTSDRITYEDNVSWVEFYQECGEYLKVLGYEEAWCPAYDQNEIYVCGMTTHSVVGYTLGCGLESGKYYRVKTEVKPESDTVVTDARLLHPQQTLTAGNVPDTRVVLTYLDGHTETVNQKATVVASKYKVTSNYAAASSGVAEGYVFPYRVVVNTLFGDSVKEAKADGRTDRELYLLAKFNKDQDVFGDDVQEVEVIGKNEEIASATESEHTDRCYAGLMHVHESGCVPAGAELHRHSPACRYYYTPDEEDLQVKVRKLASTIEIIYYSPTAMYKTCYRIESGAGTALVTKASAAFDGKNVEDFSTAVFETVVDNDEDAYRSYGVYDRIRDGADRDFPFNTFCNKVFDGLGDNPLAKTVYGIAGTCFDDTRTSLGSLTTSYACGLTPGGYYGDEFTCGREAGRYYNAEGAEVAPVCDKVVVDAGLVYAGQVIYGQQHVCTDVRLTFLDGHVSIVNAAGSDDVATVTTTYREDDVSAIGKTAEYTVSVNCLYGQTALLASRETLTFPLSVFTMSADQLALAGKTQVIVQGETLDYSGAVRFGENEITTEYYKELHAEFTDDLLPDATGAHTVTVSARMGDSVVKDTVDVWVIPAPGVFDLTVETPDVEAGTVPTFGVSVEYGEKDDAAYQHKELAGVTWEQLEEGVDLALTHVYKGVSRDFSQHVVMTVTNSAIAAGETGTDYRTGGRYLLTVQMTGNAEKTAEAEQLVHEVCRENSGHADYYADSCPVCDYQDMHRSAVEELQASAETIINGLIARKENILASYDLDDYPDSSVANRYKEQYREETEKYREAVDALEAASDSLREDSQNFGTGFGEAVTIEEIEKLFNDFSHKINELGKDAKQAEYDKLVQNAADAYSKIVELAENTDKIHGTKLTMSIVSDRLASADAAGDIPRYEGRYNGEQIVFRVAGTCDSAEQSDDEYLQDMKCRFELADSSAGEFTPWNGVITDAGEYWIKVIPDDGDYDGFENPIVCISVEQIPVQLKNTHFTKEYDGTDEFTFDRLEVEGTDESIVEKDKGQVWLDGSTFKLKSSSAGAGEYSSMEWSGSSRLHGDAGKNYSFTASNSDFSATILPRKITVSPVGTKVYDGLTDIEITMSDPVNVVTGESIHVDLSRVSAAMSDAKAGKCKKVELTGNPVIIGETAGNYEMVVGGSQVTVKPKELDYGISAADRAYDGTTKIEITLKDLDGIVGDDDVSFRSRTIVGSIPDKDVGRYSPAFGEYPELTGSDAENYCLRDFSVTEVTITPKEVTYSVTADKVYDGSAVAVISVSGLKGLLDSDDVRLASDQVYGDFGSKSPGRHTVTPIEALSLAGDGAGNYELRQLLPFEASISKKELTCRYSAQPKTYNGNTDVKIKVTDLAGAVSGDDVQLAAGTIDGVLESAACGKNIKVVSCGAVKLAGSDAACYSVAECDTEMFVDITNAKLTVTGMTEDRVYNGQKTVSVRLTGLTGVEPGMDVSLAGETVQGTMETPDAGMAKVVTVGEIPLAGKDAGKCEIALANTVTVNVMPKELRVTAKGLKKVYDGTDDGRIIVSGLGGVLAGDDVQLENENLQAKFPSAEASGHAVLTPVEQPVLVGEDAGNYTLPELSGGYASEIAKRPVFVIAKDAGPFVYGSLTDEELQKAVTLEYVNILADEYDAVIKAMTPPSVCGVSATQAGTFSISFVPGSGDATSNYSFNFSKNSGVYTVNEPATGTRLLLHTEYKSWYVDVAVDKDVKHLQTDENGDVEVYVDNPNAVITVIPVRPVRGSESETETVEIKTGMPNAVVEVTVGNDTFTTETDETGRVAVEVPQGESVTVVIEKIGTADGEDFSPPSAGTTEKYHVSPDGTVTDVAGSKGDVILGKDENGDLYWEDENGVKHPVRNEGVAVGPDQPVPSGITVDQGYDGVIVLDGVDPGTEDDPYVKVVDGNPVVKQEDSRPDAKNVEIITGMPDAFVTVTIDGETVTAETDENGSLSVSVPDDKAVIVTVEKTGNTKNDVENEPPVGTTEQYYVSPDGTVTDIVASDGEIILGKDEDGNMYWEDEDGERHPVRNEGVAVGSADPVPSGIIVDDGYDGVIILDGVDPGTGDDPYVKVADGDPDIRENEKDTGKMDVTITTGMPNAVVEVTIDDKKKTMETDGDGRLVVSVSEGKASEVTVEKTGTVGGAEPCPPPVGTVEKYHVGENGSVTDVVGTEETVVLGKDEDGNLYWEDDTGKHPVRNEGVSVGPDEPVPDKIIVTDGYDGILNLNGVDVESEDGPYIDVVDGRPDISLDGDNKIVVPEGSAGIHVTTGSAITIGPKDSTGTVDITHVDDGGNRVKPSSAAGIGGNAGEGSGDIRIDGGTITGDSIGNAPGFVPADGDPGSTVIIAGGNVETDVNSGNVIDGNGNSLVRAVIDVSAVRNQTDLGINTQGLKNGPFSVVSPADDRVSVWISGNVKVLWLKDLDGLLYKAEFNGNKNLWIAVKEPLGEQKFQLGADGSILDVITGHGTVLISKDENGRPVWTDRDGVHYVCGDGVLLNSSTTADNIIVDEYNGMMVLDSIDAESKSGPYIDVTKGKLTIVLNGDNTITVPDGSAGIHVGLDASVVIEGSGSVSVVHAGKDGNPVDNPTAAGIGGNAGEGSGQITINGGTFIKGSIGAAPGADPADTKVVINSGVIGVPVHAGSITDGSGTPLVCVRIDASVAENKNNVTATRQDDQNGVFYRVAVGDDGFFSHWIPAGTDKIYCRSDSVLYYVDLNQNPLKMAVVGGNPSAGNPAVPDDTGDWNTNSGSKPGHAGSSGGSSLGGSSGTWTPVAPVTPATPSAPEDPGTTVDPGTTEQPAVPSDQRPDRDQAVESSAASILPWLINSVIKGTLMLQGDGSVLADSRIIQFSSDVEVSFDGKSYSNQMEFGKDGKFVTDLYLYDRKTQTLVVLHGVTLVVDTTGPVIRLANEKCAFLVTGTRKNVRTYSTKTAELQFSIKDSLSGVKSVQYKLVRVGQGLKNVKWKTYKNGSRIKVPDSGAYRIYVRAYDAAGNKKYVKTNSFCVDKDKPTVNVKNLRVYKKGIVLKAKDTCGVKKMTLDGKKIKNYSAVNKRGWHKLTITDRVGHKRTVLFYVR